MRFKSRGLKIELFCKPLNDGYGTAFIFFKIINEKNDLW